MNSSLPPTTHSRWLLWLKTMLLRCLTTRRLCHTRSSAPSAGAHLLPLLLPTHPVLTAQLANNARRSPLADPVQTPTCQHLFCRACLARSLALARSCPIDRSPLDSVDDCEPAPRAVRELLDNLTVRCLLRNGACGKEMRRDEWDRHASVCGRRDEKSEAEAATVAPTEERSSGDEAEDAGATRTERCELCDVEILSSEMPVRHFFSLC